jgi:hypothetical protein
MLAFFIPLLLQLLLLLLLLLMLPFVQFSKDTIMASGEQWWKL